VIRSFGVTKLQEKLRTHIAIAGALKTWIENHPDFEIIAPVHFNLVCFRYHPSGINDQDKLNNLNEKLLLALNNTGKLYISHTKLDGCYTLRMVTGQTHVTLSHVENAWKLILEKSKTI
jgi:aromatic-L-amino-acid decarboxylase